MPKLPCVRLVNDDPTTNFLNCKLLLRLGVPDHVLVARHGQEALDRLHTQCRAQPADCPVLIFLDVNMPVLNGIQFLEAYQLPPPAQRRAMVVIMLTSSVSPRDQRRIDQLPVAEFLGKPLTQPQVERVLHAHFP